LAETRALAGPFLLSLSLSLLRARVRVRERFFCFDCFVLISNF